MNNEQKVQNQHVSQHISNEMLAAALSTQEGNFVISKFNEWTYKTVQEFIKDRSSCELHNYHEDWNKLMPVVKKIQLLEISEWSKKKPVMSALMDVDIEILWTAVVAFLKWYAVSER